MEIKTNGTEIILSKENASLKEKIKDLQKENERLREDNIRMGSRIQTIRRIVCYDEPDMEMDDWITGVDHVSCFSLHNNMFNFTLERNEMKYGYFITLLVLILLTVLYPWLPTIKLYLGY